MSILSPGHFPSVLKVHPPAYSLSHPDAIYHTLSPAVIYLSSDFLEGWAQGVTYVGAEVEECNRWRRCTSHGGISSRLIWHFLQISVDGRGFNFWNRVESMKRPGKGKCTYICVCVCKLWHRTYMSDPALQLPDLGHMIWRLWKVHWIMAVLRSLILPSRSSYNLIETKAYCFPFIKYTWIFVSISFLPTQPQPQLLCEALRKDWSRSSEHGGMVGTFWTVHLKIKTTHHLKGTWVWNPDKVFFPLFMTISMPP